MKIKEELVSLLKENWMSNYEMQQAVHSSSADRAARNIRKTPPEGWHMEQREKDVPVGYNKCLEYRLVED